MKDQLVTYEIAKELESLGFNESCLFSFEPGYGGLECKLNPFLKRNSTCDIGEITAPLWQQVIDWFREKYDLHIEVNSWYNPGNSDYDNIIYYEYYISCKENLFDGGFNNARKRIGNDKIVFYHLKNTFEEAREQAIFDAIDMVKK